MITSLIRFLQHLLELEGKSDYALECFFSRRLELPSFGCVEGNGPEYVMSSNELGRLNFTTFVDCQLNRHYPLDAISLCKWRIRRMDALYRLLLDVSFFIAATRAF